MTTKATAPVPQAVRHPHLTAPPLVGRSRQRQIGASMENKAIASFKQEMVSRGIRFNDL